MMVLVSERMAFFKDVYGDDNLEDQLEQYGPTSEPLHIEGEHFESVTRCISNRVPEFTRLLEKFVSGGSMEPEDDSSTDGGVPEEVFLSAEEDLSAEE